MHQNPMPRARARLRQCHRDRYPRMQRRAAHRVRCELLLVVGFYVWSAYCTSAAQAAGATVQVALAGSVDEVLDNIRNWIMGILGGLATVFLTVGGVRYVMAGGDPGEVEKAKGAFRSAGWGYGLAALAPLVVEILKSIVGA